MSDLAFLFRATEEQAREAMGTPERAQQSLQRWLAWVGELQAKGQLKNPGLPLDRTGKVVTGAKVTGAKQVVTDGPYAEAKDMVLGFMVVEARDVDHAVEIAGGCPMVLGGCSVEIRPVGTL